MNDIRRMFNARVRDWVWGNWISGEIGLVEKLDWWGDQIGWEKWIGWGKGIFIVYFVYGIIIIEQFRDNIIRWAAHMCGAETGGGYFLTSGVSFIF